MSKWMENVRKVEPYTPGEQPNRPNMVKLNTNECPYPPAPGVQKAIGMIKPDTLRLYPDPTASALVNELADYYNVDTNQVFVGVGSDDVIAVAFMTFFNSDKPILFPDITYSFYSVWADLFRITYSRPKLDADLKMVKDDYFCENGGIIFPNPNAPTGILEDLDTVEAIIENNRDVVVIVDEAYIDFGGKSALELIDKYDNLLVVQTFSKSRAMAGVRIGYAIGNPALIKAMNDVKFSYNSYTMNLPSLKIGVEALRDKKYFEDTLAKIMSTRENAKKQLTELGFTYPDSMANFIFATHKEKPAAEIFEALKARDIYVRYFKTPGIDNYLRITIGTDEEMDKLMSALKEIL